MENGTNTELDYVTSDGETVTGVDTLEAETEELTEETGSEGFTFNPSGFVDSLGYMGRGMLGIFLVMAVIIIATMLCDKLLPQKKKKDD